MTFEIRVDFNYPKILQKVTGYELGTYIASEWKKLINPYTPHDTGKMENTAKITPWHIEYDSKSIGGYPYPRRVYYDESLNFQTNYNPYATHHWDRAAEQAGQKETLYKQINAYLHK